MEWIELYFKMKVYASFVGIGLLVIFLIAFCAVFIVEAKKKKRHKK
jgi:hypothetical protein